jgi:hypothetical protein
MVKLIVYAKRQKAHMFEITVYELLRKGEAQTYGFKNFSSIQPNQGSITCHGLLQ